MSQGEAGLQKVVQKLRAQGRDDLFLERVQGMCRLLHLQSDLDIGGVLAIEQLLKNVVHNDPPIIIQSI